jgi:hypothetical protein
MHQFLMTLFGSALDVIKLLIDTFKSLIHSIESFVDILELLLQCVKTDRQRPQLRRDQVLHHLFGHLQSRSQLYLIKMMKCRAVPR